MPFLDKGSILITDKPFLLLSASFEMQGIQHNFTCLAANNTQTNLCWNQRAHAVHKH